jgi:hypothetical protein
VVCAAEEQVGIPNLYAHRCLRCRARRISGPFATDNDGNGSIATSASEPVKSGWPRYGFKVSYFLRSAGLLPSP